MLISFSEGTNANVGLHRRSTFKTRSLGHDSV